MIAISSVLNTGNIRLRSVCFLFAAFYVGFALYKLQKELLPLRIFLFYLIGYKKYIIDTCMPRFFNETTSCASFFAINSIYLCFLYYRVLFMNPASHFFSAIYGVSQH